MEFLDFNNSAAINEYEAFVQKMGGSFMQSTAWCGVKPDWLHEAVIVRDSKGAIIGTMLVLIKRFPMPFRPFLYAPRGPVWDFRDIQVLNTLLFGVQRLAKKYNAYSFKMDPLILETDNDKILMLQNAGLCHTPFQDDARVIQSRNNYILESEGRN